MASPVQDQMQNSSQVNDFKSESVMNFMRRIVREKYGGGVDTNFVDKEAGRIYAEFENSIFGYFKPMLSPDQQLELDKIIDQSADQETLLAFLMQSINNFELKIAQFLVEFREKYKKAPFMPAK